MRCPRCGTENQDNSIACKKCNLQLKRVCPKCRTPNDRRNIYCGSCGLKLVNICQRCKNPNPPAQKYCGNCGFKIVNFCSNCGYNNQVGQKFCGNCATRLIPDAPHPEHSRKGVTDPNSPIHASAELSQRKPANMQPPKPKYIEKPQANIPVNSHEAKPPIPQTRDKKQLQESAESHALQKSPSTDLIKAESTALEPQHTTEIAKIQPPIEEDLTQHIETEGLDYPDPIQPTHFDQEDEDELVFPLQMDKVVTPIEEPEADRYEQIDEFIPPKTKEKQEQEDQQQSQQEPHIIPDGQKPHHDIGKPHIPEHEEYHEDLEIPAEVNRKVYPVEEPGVHPQKEEIREVDFPDQDNIQEHEQQISHQEDISTVSSEPFDESPEDLLQDAQTLVEESFESEELPQSLILPPELERFAFMSAEVANYSTLYEKYDKELVSQILEKLWDIADELAKGAQEELYKVSDSKQVIAFAHTENKKASCMQAVSLAADLFNSVKMLNAQLATVIDDEIKVKIGIAFNDSETSSELERSIASAWSIIVSEEVKEETEDAYEYDIVGPLPIGNQMVKFYKYKYVESVPYMPMSEELVESEPVSAQPEGMPAADQVASPPPNQTPDKNKEEEKPQPTEVKRYKRPEIIAMLTEALEKTPQENKGRFISLVAEDGMGKTHFGRMIQQSLEQDKYALVNVKCNYQERMVPLSAAKELARNLFGIPSIVSDPDGVRKVVDDSVKGIMGESPQISQVFSSFILNDENAGIHKEHIINAFLGIFNAFCQSRTLVLLVDDYEYIDSASKEIFEQLFMRNILSLKVLFIATHQPSLDLKVDNSLIFNNINYTAIGIAKLEQNELDSLIQELIGSPIQIPDTVKQDIFNISKGIPLIIENVIYLMYELGVIANGEQGPIYNAEAAANWKVPENIQRVLQERFQRLSQVNQSAFNILQIASALGPKFSASLLKGITNMDDNFNEIIQFLSSLGYLVFEAPDTLVFKHYSYRDMMYFALIPNENKPQFHTQVLSFLETQVQSGARLDLAMLASHAEIGTKFNKALKYWNIVANRALSYGFNDAYKEIMEHYLELLERVNLQNKDTLRLEAMETMAKTSIDTDPEFAIKTLNDIIIAKEQAQDTIKLIELRGYLSCAYESLGKWDESLEETQKSLDSINSETMPLEYTAVLCSKIAPMEQKGYVGWIVNTCQNRIIPVLQKSLQAYDESCGIPQQELIKLYLNTQIAYAYALGLMGHGEATNLLKNQIIPELEKSGMKDLQMRAQIRLAKIYALHGQVKDAEAILTQTRDFLSKIPGTHPLALLWGDAACQLNMEMGSWQVLQQLIPGVKTQAEELKNYNTMALIKLCESLLIQISGDIEAAEESFGDLMNFSSTNKLANYALISWYFLASQRLSSNSLDKAEEIINNALQIAQKPDINNVNASISLRRLLAEVYIKRGALEQAAAIANEAMTMANNLANKSQIAKISLTLAQLHQTVIQPNNPNNQTEAKEAKAHLNNAKALFEGLGNPAHVKRVDMMLETLKQTCQQMGINI